MTPTKTLQKLRYYQGQLLKNLTSLEGTLDEALKNLNEMLIDDDLIDNNLDAIRQDVAYALNNNFKHPQYLLNGVIEAINESLCFAEATNENISFTEAIDENVCHISERIDFVQKCGELLHIAKPSLIKCELKQDDLNGEYVVVTCKNGYTYDISVEGNTLIAIAFDIFRLMLHK